jgi:hypothetical protein
MFLMDGVDTRKVFGDKIFSDIKISNSPIFEVLNIKSKN